MNTSKFMDKQIMELSGSKSSDLMELLNPSEAQEDQNGGEGGGMIMKKEEEIEPSYDFQPIRSHSSLGGGSRPCNSADAKPNSSAAGFRSYGSLESLESPDRGSYDAATVAEIDRTMKKHADILLHSLEGVSARLSQLETRTHNLESSIDYLKVSVGNTVGSTDGKLRQLENILREVQTGVQVLRDKQEIGEAHLQLSKLQSSSKADQPSDNTNVMHTDSLHQALYTLPQSLQPPPSPAGLQQPSPLPVLATPNVPSPPPPQQNPPPVQLPTQLTSNQIPPPPVSSIQREQYYSPPGQPTESTHHQYQMPAQQPQPTPHQHYQASMQVPQYSQPSQPPSQHQALGPVNPPPQPPPQHQALGPVNPPPQLQPSLSHPEESSYMPPPTSYPLNIRPPSSLSQPPSGSPPTQQIYGSNSHMYENPGNRPSAGQLPFSAGYGPPSVPSFSDSYPYSASPSHYSSSSMKPPQHSSPSVPAGGNSYPRLPTVHTLPHALPTATSVNSGSSSGGSGNRVPIDDVVDKVATMGFSRDQVRAAVRKLTENGQSVDLNVVLDKLMNDGDVQPQKGWFGR